MFNLEETIQRCFYKKLYKGSDGVNFECKLNDHFTLSIKLHVVSIKGYYNESFEVGFCHQSNLGTWVDFNFYGISGEELVKNLSSYEKRLIKAWNSSNEDS